MKKKKDALESDIAKIKEAEKDLPQLIDKRESLFINFFKMIFEEKGKLKDIYSPLEDILKISKEENEKII